MPGTFKVFLLSCAVPLIPTIILIAGNETAPTQSGAREANSKLGRGINLGNALDAPREGAWGVTLEASFFKIIREAGFASIRLPIRWSAHAHGHAPYTLDASFVQRVDWAIEEALSNRLNVVINVHHYGEMDVDPDRHLPRLVAIWQQIAARYRDRPPGVFFELLNEPHDKLIGPKWNTVLRQLLAAVRKTNPERPVIVGPANWNGIGSLDTLDLPADDRNLIVTVHFYEPFQFTHQGASWTKGAEKWRGRTWSAKDSEQAAIRKLLDKAASWSKAHERPIFLGEFGSYQVADMDSRARWTRFVAREAEKRGFSWAYWEFCSGFGAYDLVAKSWRAPLRAALLD